MKWCDGFPMKWSHFGFERRILAVPLPVFVSKQIHNTYETTAALFPMLDILRQPIWKLLQIVLKLIFAIYMLGGIRWKPKPPVGYIVSDSGKKHSIERDAQTVGALYDMSNEYFKLMIGPSMVYSMAYFHKPPSSNYTLEDAQFDKLDLICKKLKLKCGQRLLDIGCGWGALAIHAAKHYGVSVVGVTISEQQVIFGRNWVKQEGLQDLVDIRMQDYREVQDGPYDAISVIEMLLHLGKENLPIFTQQVWKQLKDNGSVLITEFSFLQSKLPRGASSLLINVSFIRDVEIFGLIDTINSLDKQGFELQEIECIRDQLKYTAQNWYTNFKKNENRCRELLGEGKANSMEMMLGSGQAAAERGLLSYHYIVASKPGKLENWVIDGTWAKNRLVG